MCGVTLVLVLVLLRAGDHIGKYKMLSILNWEHRKGWDVLLRAYLSEFRRSEPVRGPCASSSVTAGARVNCGSPLPHPPTTAVHRWSSTS